MEGACGLRRQPPQAALERLEELAPAQRRLGIAPVARLGTPVTVRAEEVVERVGVVVAQLDPRLAAFAAEAVGDLVPQDPDEPGAHRRFAGEAPRALQRRE